MLQVFEIEDQQIVCYTDEKGEVICEGYDEGPRLTRQTSDIISNQRWLTNEYKAINQLKCKAWIVSYYPFLHGHREIEIPDARGRRLRAAEDGINYCTKGVAQMISPDVLMN